MKKYSVLIGTLVITTMYAVGCTNGGGGSGGGSPSGGESTASQPPAAAPAPKTPTLLVSKSGSVGTLTTVTGTYTNCGSTNAAWTVQLNMNNDNYTIASNDISVPQNENSCILNITGLTISGSGTYTNATGIPLNGNYLSTPVAFASTVPEATPATIYANANISESNATGESSQILISFQYADSPTASIFTGLAEISSGAAIQNVQAPDYTVQSATNIQVVRAQANSGQTGAVLEASGNLTLQSTVQAGESYVIINGLVGGTDNESLASAFQAVPSTSVYAINNAPGTSSFSIPASSFALVGLTASPIIRSIVIQHTDSGSNIRTYEVITIPF